MAEADRRPPAHVGTPLKVTFLSVTPLPLTEATALAIHVNLVNAKLEFWHDTLQTSSAT